MDCLRTLPLALGVACFALGCTHVTGLPVTEPVDPRRVHKVEEQDLPRRDPKPSTCVGCAEFRVQMATTDPHATAADKQRLYDEARRAYQQAIRIDPNYLPAYEGLGKLYVLINDYPRAVETYHKALKKNEKEPRLWFELGMCYARQKQWEPAIKDLQTAWSLDPENRQYADTLGFCLARAGRYDESLACFRKAVGEAMAHYNLARMLHHMHQDGLSQQQLAQALRVDPDLEPAQEMLAQLQGPPPTPTSPPRPAIALGFESIDDAASQATTAPTTGTMIMSN
jgi:tetratricopeptide (TPR) repeat protein